MALSILQIQALLRQAGWPENEIVTMSAVTLGESSGVPTAHNTKGEDSVGLLQVNRNAWPQYSVAELQNPLRNLQVALTIYHKQGKHAWGAYTNGSYKKFLPQAQAAYNGGGGYVANTSDIKALINNPAPATQGNDKIVIYAAAALLGIVLITR